MRRDALEIASSELLNRRQCKAYARHRRHRRQSHSCLDGPASTMEKPCGARWGMVAKHRITSRIEAQGGARSVRRDALEIAASELLNRRQCKAYARHRRHRRQSHSCLDGPASAMEKPCRARWGMVAKHRIPSRIHKEPVIRSQTWCRTGGARSVRRDALEIASSELLKRRQRKAYMQGIEGIEGKAIAVWMDRPVPWKSPVEHGGAWLRNTGSPAGLKPKAVPEACAEMLSK